MGKPSQVKAEIVSRFKAGIRRSLLIESSPGLGKTQLAAQAAKELNVAFRAIHAPLMQPEDYGFPVISAARDNVNFIVSREKFPIVGSDCPEAGILLIDELGQCDNAGQKVLANLIQEREIHGQKIKDGWMIVATGNRTTDRAGSNRILSHLRNRVCTIPLECSLDDWTQWALNNGVQVEVISFIRFRPEQLNAFDPQNEVNATPRAWAEGVSKSLGVTAPEMEMEIYSGDVGEKAGAEFLGFLKIFRKLPSPDQIMLNPAKAPLPELGKDKDAGQVLYALCGALSHRASADNFGRIMLYIGRMTGEFQSLFVKLTITCKTGKADKCECKGCSIARSPDFINWASGDGAKILT